MTPRILVTAFEPFGPWTENASRLCLEELAVRPPAGVELLRRVLPVDFERATEALRDELGRGVHAALALGQEAGADRVRLESRARNGRCPADGATGAASPDLAGDGSLEALVPLRAGGPDELESPLPLEAWCGELARAGLPAEVSVDAGLYVCNAVAYALHVWSAARDPALPALFVHLPLDPVQGRGPGAAGPVLPRAASARAVAHLVTRLAGRVRAGGTPRQV